MTTIINASNGSTSGLITTADASGVLQLQTNNGTPAINFTPKPGMFMFAPAWLPHAFSRHGSKKPFRFIHFNMGVQAVRQQVPDISITPTAEVV